MGDARVGAAETRACESLLLELLDDSHVSDHEHRTDGLFEEDWFVNNFHHFLSLKLLLT